MAVKLEGRRDENASNPGRSTRMPGRGIGPGMPGCESSSPLAASLSRTVDRRIRLDQGRHQSALPIIAVNDIRRTTDATDRLNGGTAKKGESLGIVGIVAGRRSRRVNLGRSTAAGQ